MAIPEEWENAALACGFTHVWALDAKKLRFCPEVREMCAADKCHNYNRSWVCPPAFGDIEQGKKRAAAFSRGILVQTVRKLEDSFDIEGIDAAARAHAVSFGRLHTMLRRAYPGLFAMGAGGCTLCESCTWPSKPCRKPEAAVPSMEAWGLLVSDVCDDCGAPYYFGPETMMFAACFLMD